MLFNYLAAALGIWARIALPGAAWAWFAIPLQQGGKCKTMRWLEAGVSTLITGIVLMGLRNVVLGALGWFSPTGEWGSILILSALGVVCRFLFRPRIRIRLQPLLLALVILPVILIAIALPNHRGEWIVGGWDPGVYAGQAASLARTHTHYPPDTFFHEELTPEEQAAFTRTGQGRTERFPAVVVPPDKPTLSFEFFRFAPSFFASFYRAGGVHVLVRANLIIALLTIPCFFLFAWKFLSFPYACMAAFFLMAQPIWLYHTHWPLTEHLQLFLLMALVTLNAESSPTFRNKLLTALILLCGVLNRHSFLPFAGLFLLCQTIQQASETNRKRIASFPWLGAAACMLGAWINHRIAPASLHGWDDTNLIHTVATIAIAGSFILTLLFFNRRLREIIQHHLYEQKTVAGLVILLLVCSWLFRGHIGKTADMDNIQRLLPFTGVMPWIMAAIGTVGILLQQPRKRSESYIMLFLFLLGAAWLMILRKTIMDLYPWATRRYLTSLVPVFALAVAWVPVQLWRMPRPRIFRLIAIMLMLVTVAELTPISKRAWKYTSYNGIAEQLDALSAQIHPGDIIIADHPFWGTPLALIYGHTVLNGREVWSNSGNRRRDAMKSAIARLSGPKHRFLVLSSSGQGPGIFGAAIEKQSVLVWKSPAFSYQEIIQHPRADCYALRTNQKILQLHEIRTSTNE